MLQDIEAANPTGDVFIITDNLSSHNSKATRTWLADHPRLYQVFIPKGACWLNMQEGWWRLFRRDALAGQTFADAEEIERATCVATRQLNRRAKPWVWVDLLKRLVIVVDSFVTAFKEQSNSGTLLFRERAYPDTFHHQRSLYRMREYTLCCRA
jgi:transposase